jgi:maltooligosyltrehalose trehalohydrolase
MTSADPGPPPLLGATVRDGRTTFVVWAPGAERVALELGDGGSHPMERADDGTWTADLAGIGHGERYAYSVDGGPARPDPASGWQPDGVHAPSAVVDPAGFAWTDDEWRGRTLPGTVLYELHVGTFTPGGTLDDAIAELPRLAALGITTIELMPLNEFAGERNWGYDGVLPFAVHHAYGGPEALARFVDAAHGRGIAVVLDVVYNHLGPEGNYLPEFGPYFTDAYHTPWGAAINVADAGSDGVRRFFAENARRWIRDFHVDGFRFDAVHAIVDPTANPFWAEICDAARDEAAAARRKVVLIAESSDNDPRQLHGRDRDGIGFDAVWCDDVHHTLRVAVTGDRRGYYVDYDGSAAELADTVGHRWKFRGQFSAARGRRHGRPVDDVAPHRFVICDQNHDQVGNRPAGDRPDRLVRPEQRRFTAAAILLLPATPMLFQGEEYGEPAPFPFFVDHTDPAILRATNEGRRAEFAGADWSVEVPEPGARATFESAILDPGVVERDERAAWLLAMYTELLRLRRDVEPVASPDAHQRVSLEAGAVTIRRSIGDTAATVVLNESDEPIELPVGGELAFASDDGRWGGADGTALDDGVLRLAPWSVALVTSG